MRQYLLLVRAIAAIGGACSRTPSGSGEDVQTGAIMQADGITADSAMARGGNLMGSGH